MTAMFMWTVYDHPSDFPTQFVARKWSIIKGFDRPVPTSDYVTSNTLEGVRELIPQGMVRMERLPNDDPCIVEVWL